MAIIRATTRMTPAANSVPPQGNVKLNMMNQARVSDTKTNSAWNTPTNHEFLRNNVLPRRMSFIVLAVFVRGNVFSAAKATRYSNSLNTVGNRIAKSDMNVRLCWYSS